MVGCFLVDEYGLKAIKNDSNPLESNKLGGRERESFIWVIRWKSIIFNDVLLTIRSLRNLWYKKCVTLQELHQM